MENEQMRMSYLANDRDVRRALFDYRANESVAASVRVALVSCSAVNGNRVHTGRGNDVYESHGRFYLRARCCRADRASRTGFTYGG